MHILETNCGERRNLRLWEIAFNHSLSIGDAVEKLVCKIRWKLAAILCTVRFFTHDELVYLYKSHVLSHIEYRTAAIYHACDTIMAQLNAIKTMFFTITLYLIKDCFVSFQFGASNNANMTSTC